MDTRLKQFKYWDNLQLHAKGREFFKDHFAPRQLEIHLPGNHLRPCTANCVFCQGRGGEKTLYPYENDALELLENLKGQISNHIYSGHYTEPTINPYLLSFIAKTKKYKNHFGLYTNGTMLADLEESQGFITELCNLATDNEDYIVISLDAGFPWSWMRVKNVRDQNRFNKILWGIKRIMDLRKKNGETCSVRINYIINEENDNVLEFQTIMNIACELGVDSLRFTLPDGTKANKDYEKIINDLIGGMKLLSTKIFYMGQEFVDPDKYKFTKCISGYHSIVLAADGYFYRCCKTAGADFPMCKLGRVTGNVKDFMEIIKKNQDEKFNAQTCMKCGVYCDKAGYEINNKYNARSNNNNSN